MPKNALPASPRLQRARLRRSVTSCARQSRCSSRKWSPKVTGACCTLPRCVCRARGRSRAAGRDARGAGRQTIRPAAAGFPQQPTRGGTATAEDAEQQVALLSAQVARREAELEARRDPTNDGRSDGPMNMTREAALGVLELTIARNRALEADVKVLEAKLKVRRPASTRLSRRRLARRHRAQRWSARRRSARLSRPTAYARRRPSRPRARFASSSLPLGRGLPSCHRVARHAQGQALHPRRPRAQLERRRHRRREAQTHDRRRPFRERRRRPPSSL